MLRYPIQAVAAVFVASWVAFLPGGAAAANLEDLRSALSAAVEQSRLLFNRTESLRRGHRGNGDPSGLHVEKLSVAVQGTPLPPLRAFSGFVPAFLKEPGREGVGAFVAGHARLAPRDARVRGGLGMESRGLALGSDLRLSRRTSAGLALGYASTASGGGPRTGLEMETVALYGTHVRGPLSIEALAGSGRTQLRRTEAGEAGGAILFAGVGTRWEWQPTETITLSPSLRLNYGEVDPCGDVDGPAGLGRIGLVADFTARYRLNTTWGVVTPWASAELQHQTYRGRTGAAMTAQAGNGVLPRRKPLTTFRLGVAADLDSGGRFTVEHAVSRDEWGQRSHAVNARMRWRF